MSGGHAKPGPRGDRSVRAAAAADAAFVAVRQGGRDGLAPARRLKRV
jgi:hypothetical protein